MTRLRRTIKCLVFEQQQDVLNQTVISLTVLLTVLLPAKFYYYKKSSNYREACRLERETFEEAKGEGATQKTH